jgi:hypothetical protein
MPWQFLQVAGETYAVVSVIGFVFAMAVCRGNKPYAQQEEFARFEEWRKEREAEERELYRH